MLEVSATELRNNLFGYLDKISQGETIVILVLSQRLTFQDKLRIKARIFESLEDQTIHMVLGRDTTDPFVRVALEKGILLS